MLQKFLMISLLLQSVSMADDVTLSGVDTLQKMCIELSSEDTAYLNKVYYEHSKKDAETLLDLYWAMQCTTHINALPYFAKAHEADTNLMELQKLHLSESESYEQRVKSIYHDHCEKVEATMASR